MLGLAVVATCCTGSAAALAASKPWGGGQSASKPPRELLGRAAYSHFETIQTRWNDMDAQQHVWFSVSMRAIAAMAYRPTRLRRRLRRTETPSPRPPRRAQVGAALYKLRKFNFVVGACPHCSLQFLLMVMLVEIRVDVNQRVGCSPSSMRVDGVRALPDPHAIAAIHARWSPLDVNVHAPRRSRSTATTRVVGA